MGESMYMCIVAVLTVVAVFVSTFLITQGLVRYLTDIDGCGWGGRGCCEPLTYIVADPQNTPLSIVFVAYEHNDTANTFPKAVLVLKNSGAEPRRALVQIAVYSKKEVIAYGELHTEPIPVNKTAIIAVPLTWRQGYTVDDVANITVTLKHLA